MRILWLAALLAASPAASAGPQCSTTLPQEELNRCFVAAFEETEGRLDGLLQELRKTLDGKRWSRVKESQGLWEKVRDMDCKVEASFLDGRAREAVRYGCSEKRARERMHQLRYYLCPRYNLTGQCDAVRQYE